MKNKINEPTKVIAAAHERWKRNRDILSGEDAVKAARDEYLPRLGNQTDVEYAKYLKRVPFFPGAARTHDGLLGLVTRKQALLEAPTAMASIFETVTRSGHDVNDLAEEVMSEVLHTAFHGLLVDYPASVGARSLLDAERDLGSRPYINQYVAESILEVTPGVVANRKKLVRVRLLEDDGKTVRELLLVDGVYTIILHYLIEGDWYADDPQIPLRQGKPLDEIPFILVTPKAKATDPVKGPLDDVCLLNVHLYHAQADAQNSRFYSSAPILTILGAEQTDLTISPGTVLFFPNHTKEEPVEIGFREFSGAGQTTLENAVATGKDEMAKLGSNILASEKSAAEAAETHAIRRSSENSVLSGLARSVSRDIEEALNLVAWWAGQADKKAVKFALNTDFVPSPMTAEERKATLAEYLSGAISWETFIALYMDGEVLPESFDIEEERQKIAAGSAGVDRAMALEAAANEPQEEDTPDADAA